MPTTSSPPPTSTTATATATATATPIPTIAPHLTSYLAPLHSYTNFFTPGNNNQSRLVASTIPIHNSRILLLQRAAHEFQPLKWETPGGRAESQDENIIAAALRELTEETGLIAARVLDVVGEYGWMDNGRPWRKVCFLVEVGEDPVVRVDPAESAGFVWVSEEEVRRGVCDGRILEWTSLELRGLVLDAFRLVRGCGDGEGQ